jgi:6-phosphogluconolactonase
MPDWVFVGTYTRRGSEGIYAFQVEPETGDLTQISCAPCEHPSFITLSPDQRFLYAVNELGKFREHDGGGASAFAVDWETGALSLLNDQPVHGADPCHAQVDPTGHWLVTANYTGGSHSVLPIEEDGRLGMIRSLLRHSGSGDALAHSSQFSPDGKRLYACALGLNQVVGYEFDAASGAASPASHADMPAGAGPRHLALHPTLSLLYVINESGSTVSVLSRGDASGRMEVLQTLPTLPAGSSERNSCADLHLSPDGRFLYGSNRGHNSLAVFAIGNDGLLSPIGHVPTGGDCPRGFGVLANGLILVANERSDNIVAFRIGEDGMPVATGAATSVPSPTCVLA